jgi:hypothetical protein
MSVSIWYREGVSPQEWEAHAVECEQNAHAVELDKQRILDDDGYAFYHDGMYREHIREARLARNHGVDYENALLDLEGNVVDAKVVDGKYGKVWRVNNPDGSVSWVNVSVANSYGKQQKFYEGKGYKLANVYYHFARGQYGFYPIKERGVVSVVVLQDEQELV